MTTAQVNLSGANWRSGLLFPILVALTTLGLGGGVQFLMWGGAVSENLKQLDTRLATLDQRLDGLYPRTEAVAANELMRQTLSIQDQRLTALAGRVEALEQQQR